MMWKFTLHTCTSYDYKVINWVWPCLFLCFFKIITIVRCAFLLFFFTRGWVIPVARLRAYHWLCAQVSMFWCFWGPYTVLGIEVEFNDLVLYLCLLCIFSKYRKSFIPFLKKHLLFNILIKTYILGNLKNIGYFNQRETLHDYITVFHIPRGTHLMSYLLG